MQSDCDGVELASLLQLALLAGLRCAKLAEEEEVPTETRGSLAE